MTCKRTFVYTWRLCDGVRTCNLEVQTQTPAVCFSTCRIELTGATGDALLQPGDASGASAFRGRIASLPVRVHVRRTSARGAAPGRPPARSHACGVTDGRRGLCATSPHRGDDARSDARDH